MWKLRDCPCVWAAGWQELMFTGLCETQTERGCLEGGVSGPDAGGGARN